MSGKLHMASGWDKNPTMCSYPAQAKNIIDAETFGKKLHSKDVNNLCNACKGHYRSLYKGVIPAFEPPFNPQKKEAA